MVNFVVTILHILATDGRTLRLLALTTLLALQLSCTRNAEPAPATTQKAVIDRQIAVLGDDTRLSFIRDLTRSLQGREESQDGVLNSTVVYHGTPIRFSAAERQDVSTDAKLAWQADIVLLATDSSQGPLPIQRERALLARQMVAPTVAVLFTNCGLVDDPELLHLEELEMRELLNKYKLDGDAAMCLFDDARAKVKEGLTVKRGSESIALWAPTVTRRAVSPTPPKSQQLKLYVYALTRQEGYKPGLATGLRTEDLSILARGAAFTGHLQCDPPLPDGANGECGFVCDPPAELNAGTRIAILRDGHIVGAAVVTAP